jgi:two-component system, chemotaxis family, CheB/CheR fusion protein
MANISFDGAAEQSLLDGFAGGGPLSPPTENRVLPDECVPQVTGSQSDGSTDVDSVSPASTDIASVSTESKDAIYTLPIGIRSQLIELSFEPIMVWDRDSGIVAWNRGCEQLYGYSRSESLGRTSHDLLQTRFSQPFAEIEQAIEQHGTWSGELRHLTRTGAEIIVESRWQLTRIGERELVLETNRDITERKAAQEALRRADRQKDEFLAMLAHELRNPLAPIRNAALLLNREIGANSRLGTLTAMITRQSQHLTRLLDDLLDVSRIARGRIVLQSESLEIGEIIEPAIEMVQPLMNEKLHKLRVDRPGQPLHVHGDRARLVQCLSNLLNNSAKYSAARSEIVLVVGEAPDSVTIEVRDNGAGISPELLPEIFDLFIQGARPLDRSQGGLGIGLSIVKRLVEMHQGTVSAASEGIGRGCTFSIRLPRMAAPERAAADCVAPTAPKRRILVVDDNADIADSLAMLLRLEGHDVAIAYSGPEAFEAVQRVRPEAVFLDIGLPQMDGYEIARRLRADPAAKRVHLIALTGYGQEQDRERAREAGFGAHLVKPVDIEAVYQILASLPPGL